MWFHDAFFQDRNQAAMTVLNGHVVVCLFADPDSPLIGRVAMIFEFFICLIPLTFYILVICTKLKWYASCSINPFPPFPPSKVSQNCNLTGVWVSTSAQQTTNRAENKCGQNQNPRTTSYYRSNGWFRIFTISQRRLSKCNTTALYNI